LAEVIHLDSCILRALLDPEDERERISRARRLINSRSDATFRVSILAIGEVFGKMAETRPASACGDAAAELSRLIRSERIELYGIGKRNEALNIAASVIGNDPLVSPADALLVSCAMTDKACGTFVTMDRILRESSLMRDLASEHDLRVVRLEEALERRGKSVLCRPARMEMRPVKDERALTW
jgi:hypothetical protein